MLEALGLGPRQRASRTASAERAWSLSAYQPPTARRPACMLIPAPIKRAYIFDLAPGASVVERCLDAGFATYLVCWKAPAADDQDHGLAEYADRWLVSAVDTVAAETAETRPFLVGHSLGGMLAAIFAALHPNRLGGLVLLETPLHFGPDAGALGRLVAASPRIAQGCPTSRTIPGTYLDVSACCAAPATFLGAPTLDWVASLVAGLEAVRLHAAVTRWTLDELAMPGRLFRQVADDLYRDNAFMHGTLEIAGRRAAPGHVRAPVLSVFNPGSEIVPPASVLPFHDATASRTTRILAYHGDTGVALQHVGVLVGPAAHREIWPQILGWLAEH